MNRRGTEPYARWCERTGEVTPPPTRFWCGCLSVAVCQYQICERYACRAIVVAVAERPMLDNSIYLIIRHII